MKTRLASLSSRTVSRIFGPVLIVPLIVLYLLFFHLGLTIQERLTLGPIILLTNYILPVLIFLLFRAKGYVHDNDASNLAERRPVIALMMVCWWVGVWMAFLYKAPWQFTSLLGFMALVTSVVVWMSSYTKVSIHAAGITMLYLVINVVFHWRYWWLFPAIVLVGWSRIYLKHHTFIQILAGILGVIAVFLTGGFVMLE